MKSKTEKWRFVETWQKSSKKDILWIYCLHELTYFLSIASNNFYSPDFLYMY